MKRRGLYVEYMSRSVRRSSAGLLDDERHGVALVEEPQLSVGSIGGGGVEKYAARDEVPVNVGDQSRSERK